MIEPEPRIINIIQGED
jgi:hypothetical protein